MFNPDNQYRCTIIRGKALKDLDNLLPAYANIVSEITPSAKKEFDNQFNDYLSKILYSESFTELGKNHQKTIRNHITEIAGKLFGMFYQKDGIVFESESCVKLLKDNDQPAFFKNLCLNFQFPNGTQKIQTIEERIADKISFKPFHFILSLLKLARKNKVVITKDEIGYYVLNSKEVLQGKIKFDTVLKTIISNRENNVIKKLESGSRHTQHIREQLNLLSLANLILIDNNSVLLNSFETKIIDIFINDLDLPLKFNILKYNLTTTEGKKELYPDWAEYFGNIYIDDYEILSTSIEALQGNKKEDIPKPKKGIDHTILGDAGEEYVFEIEKERVKLYNPRLVNKVIMLGKQRGIGYDISSVEANENKENPDFARYIEVKATKRTTEPSLDDENLTDTINLTRKEWVAAEQFRSAYNIYRVYFTPNSTIVRKINNPFDKNEKGLIYVRPTMYRMDFGSNSIDKQY